MDLAGGNEETIGERAFHPDPEVVIDLARCWLDGVGRLGFAGVGKHFPGHGTARGDTHVDEVEDGRPLDRMHAEDLAPFAALAERLGGVMTSHVRFPVVDVHAAVTFSETWIRGVLRSSLGFAGIVFSDDLSMKAARERRGSPEARVMAALSAGCDAALLMNDRAAVVRVLDGWIRATFRRHATSAGFGREDRWARSKGNTMRPAALLGEHLGGPGPGPGPGPRSPRHEGG